MLDYATISKGQRLIVSPSRFFPPKNPPSARLETYTQKNAAETHNSEMQEIQSYNEALYFHAAA